MKNILTSILDYFKLKKVKPLDLIAGAILLLSYILYFAYFHTISLDFNLDVNIKSGWLSKFDKNNNMYIIDRSKERILKIVNGKVDVEIHSSSHNGFYQAENIAFDNNGNFYVHSIEWNKSGFFLANEKILKYNSKNQYIETIYEVNYSPAQEVDKHQIFNISWVDGELEFIKADHVGFYLMRISQSNDCYTKKNYTFENAVTLIQNFAIDKDNDVIFLADKRGAILYTDGNEIKTYCSFDGTMVTPYSVAVGSDGSVYFSDIYNVAINKISTDKSIEEVVSRNKLYYGRDFQKNEGLLFNVSVDNVKLPNGDQKDIISTIYDDNSVYAITQDGEILFNTKQFMQRNNYLLFETTIYTVIGLCVLCLIYIILRIFFVLLLNKFKIKLIHKIEIIIVLTTIVVSSLIIPMTLPVIKSTYKESLCNKLLSVATIASNNFDTKLIEQINGPSNFMDENYRKIIDFMHNLFTDNMESLDKMGAQLEKYQDGTAYAIAYPDTSISSFYPLDENSADIIKEIYETKQSNVVYLDNSGGSFIFARTPIFNTNGDIVAVINVAKDSVIIDEIVNRLVIDIFVDLVLILIAVIFILNEIIEFISNKKLFLKEKKVNISPLPKHTIRAQAFFLNMAIGIPTSFLPVFVMMFYSEELGVPKILAGSIPIFINLLLIGISNVIAPTFYKNVGLTKGTILSAICLISSDIMLALSGSYYSVFTALILNGLGYGLIKSFLYSYLSGIDISEQQDIFNRRDAGNSAGFFLGTILGAFLANVLSHNHVFWFEGLLDFIVLMLIINIIRNKVDKTEDIYNTQSGGGFLHFLFSKDRIAYLTLILMIFGIIAGFANYYLPIWGNENGLNEKEISLVLTFFSISKVFLTIPLTNTIYKVFKKNSIYFTILSNLGILLIIVFFNNIYIIIVGILMLGIVQSFSFGVFRQYFLSGNDDKLRISDDKAVTTFEFVASLGISSSSLVFGIIISVGRDIGISIFVAVSLIFVTIYRIFFEKKH